MRRLAVGLSLVVLLSLAACGGATTDPPTGAPPGPTSEATPPSEGAEPSDLEAPPPVTVRAFDREVTLQAWAYCYGSVCVDGAPPADPPGVGNPEEVFVEFPLPGWSFTASFQPAGDKCRRIQEVPLEPVGEGRFVLRPAGRAGAYDVTLFGQGNGDLFVIFRWTTPADGVLPTPRARLAVLADDDGAVDSYGVELELTNLARTPKEASARITVESADGDTVAFDATRARGGCWPEGTVYWDGPDEEGLAAAALREGPFTYTVELVLDGDRFVATASWPDGEIAGNEPSVALYFTPSLPGLS